MADSPTKVLKETTIWVGKDMEILTSLILNPEFLLWKTTKSSFSISISCIIGACISESSNRSFKVLSFTQPQSKFKTYEFTAVTWTQAQEWCEAITNTTCPELQRRLCILVNPICGNGKSIKVLEKELKPVLKYSPVHYDIFTTAGPNFIDELIQRRDFSVYSDVICLGGDGTFQQCINAIYKHQRELMLRIRFGIIPVGSRNALSCEINGKSLQNAVFNVIKGLSFCGDTMKVIIKGQEFLATTAVSWGVISDATDEAQHLRVFGAQRYNVVALKKFFTKWKEYNGIVTFEDSLGQMISFTSGYVMAVITNNRVPNSENAEIVMPAARINDGYLHLLIMFYTSKCKTLRTLMKMQKNGQHQNSPNVNFIKTRKVKIDPTNLMVFNVDGEIHYSNSITIEIMPSSLNYLGQLNYKN